MYQEQDIDLESTWIVSQVVTLGTCEEGIGAGLLRLACEASILHNFFVDQTQTKRKRCPVLIIIIMILIINQDENFF